jgi:Tol biopolymer transport system component
MLARPTALVLCLLIAACTSRSSGSNLEQEAPSAFRLLATAEAHQLLLRWDPPAKGPAPVGYWLYLGRKPVTRATKGDATRFDVPVRLIAPFDPAPGFTLSLPPGSGRFHVAVETRRAGGSIGPLSANLEIDTGQHVAWLEEDTDGSRQLLATSLDSFVNLREAIGSGPAHYEWSPFGTRLTYLKESMLFTAIFTGDRPRLAATSEAPPPLVSRFHYSADGKTIGFLGRPRWMPLPIGLHAGAEPYRLAPSIARPHGGDVKDFAWDREARRLAYIADGREPDTQALYLVWARGGVRPAVLDPILNVQPGPGHTVVLASWSPDASRLAYVLHDSHSGREALHVVGSEFPHASALLANGELPHERDALQWSIDGRQLAWRGRRDGERAQDLWQVELDRGSAGKVNDPLPAGGAVTQFARQPVGAGLAFLAHGANAQRTELYVVPATGAPPQRVDVGLRADETVTDFAWSSDGRHLGCRIATLAPAAARDRLRIVSPEGVSIVGASGYEVRAGSLGWSPDGVLLSFLGTREEPVRAPHRLWTLHVATGAVTDLSGGDGRRVVSYRWSQLGWRDARGIEASPFAVQPPKDD